MLKKFLSIIGNFYKTLKTKERFEALGFPVLLTLITFLFIKDIPGINLSPIVIDFNNSILTIVTLLSAFGVAAVTMLFTSSSNNVEKAKEFATDRKNIDNIPISYYQLLLIRNYYSLLMQFLLMIFSLLLKFIPCNFSNKIIILSASFLIYHIITIQLSSIISLYYLMWKDKK